MADRAARGANTGSSAQSKPPGSSCVMLRRVNHRLRVLSVLGTFAPGLATLTARDARAHTWTPKQITSCYANTPDRQRNIYCYWSTYTLSEWGSVPMAKVELHRSTISGFSPTPGGPTYIYSQTSNFTSSWNSSGLTPCTWYYFRQVHIETNGDWVLGNQKAAMTDCPPVDSGVVDTGLVDTGLVDTGLVDTGLVDTGLVDTGLVDTGLVDTGLVDTGLVDTGLVDTGLVDTGAVDSGSPPDTAPIEDSNAREDTFVADTAEEEDTGSPGDQDTGPVDASVDAALDDSGELEDGGPEGYTRPDPACDCVVGPGARRTDPTPALVVALAALVAGRRARRRS
ncbi:MAG: hypothetical protein HYV09_27290 [Deltaproteobacteria bacterium]|nr:hypothetical protein [Deltaproteobacteria bacterium]